MTGDPGGRAVRLALRAEAPAVAALVARALHTESLFLPQGEATAARIEALMATGEFLVLDDARGELAGCVYVRIDGTRGQFALLSLEPELIGTGLGRRLVSIAELCCQAHGCELIELFLSAPDEAAPPLYRSLGYAANRSDEPGAVLVMSKVLARAALQVEAAADTWRRRARR